MTTTKPKRIGSLRLVWNTSRDYNGRHAYGEAVDAAYWNGLPPAVRTRIVARGDVVLEADDGDR
jgi:hypothetical protein